MNIILLAITILAILGLIFGLLLAFAAKKFVVKVDPKIQEIFEILPGLNCGACGMAGCMNYAQGIINDNLSITKCSPGGNDVIQKISTALGKDAESSTKLCAVLHCQGDINHSPQNSEYRGINDCRALAIIGGVHKRCAYGCLGLGDCARVCPVSAITLDEKTKLPVINRNTCVACGLCVKECPMSLIKLLPFDKTIHVLCSAKEKGMDVKNICDIGCITCGICAKVCPENAITIEDNLAHIDHEKCSECGICVSKCPTHAIKHFFMLKG